LQISCSFRSFQGPLTGYVASALVVVIWSFWLVISRFGASSVLTIYDLAALRYGISGLISLPLVLYFKPWRGMSLYRMVVLSAILGPVYILTVFAGFLFAPVAHAGVFMNGFLPIFSILLGWGLFATRPLRLQAVGAVIILLGAVVLTANSGELLLLDGWKGDALFLIGAAFFASYLVLSRRWQVKTTQVLLCGAVINGLFFIPIWALFLPSGMAQAAPDMLLLQMIYQGLVPNLLGLILIAHAARTIGAEVTSGWLAAVPAVATVLGAGFLNETLSLLSWVGLVVLTAGLCVVAFGGATPSAISDATDNCDPPVDQG